MHVATQLNESLFEARLAGAEASRSDVLPDWHPHDRLGVVLHEPFGATGASLLIQLATTAFYDVRPERRAAELAHYPEIYLFHVGGAYGDHTMYDFWPPRKEVTVDPHPAAVLDALNDRAITRLAVPAGPPRPVEYPFKERETALDRIAGAWIYSPSGRVDDADVEIIGTGGERTEENTTYALDPRRTIEEMGGEAIDPDTAIGRDTRRWLDQVERRVDEVPADIAAAIAGRREGLRTEAGIKETYRRASVDEALARLIP
ncbi:MAG: hypothetical protein JST53_02295 [Actinobacteria bacterium]|nr:hypothetical protein [Actinomycetota bacterium]